MVVKGNDLSLLITNAEINEIRFSGLTEEEPSLSVDVSLIVGGQRLTTVTLRSQEYYKDMPQYLDVDMDKLQPIINELLATIKKGAFLSLEKACKLLK